MKQIMRLLLVLLMLICVIHASQKHEGRNITIKNATNFLISLQLHSEKCALIVQPNKNLQCLLTDFDSNKEKIIMHAYESDRIRSTDQLIRKDINLSGIATICIGFASKDDTKIQITYEKFIEPYQREFFRLSKMNIGDNK